MYTVYKHTSPSNKVYIGITNRSPKLRWNYGNGYAHSPHFQNAINKYGWDNIKHEILFTGLTKEEAEAKEVELIAKYKSTQREYGYNCDSGGGVRKHHTEETKEKIRQAHLGMKYDEEFCKKQSILKKGNKNMLGKKHSEESRRKMSEAQKGKFAGEKNFFHTHKFYGKDHVNSKPVARYDLTGKYIDSRDCGEDYVRELGIINSTHIFEVCKGKRKKAYGYIWRYVKPDDNAGGKYELDNIVI